jgi:RNA 2',3'-cyclic 3'-phosphodiesterase
MRLFAALPVPTAARSAIGALVGELRADADAGWPVRWTLDEQLHLTLKFYGEIAPERLAELGDALRVAAAGTPPLDCVVTALGTLPPGRRGRVVVAAIDAPAALELLQDRVERGSAALGFPVEGRAFRPHVTLGRLRRGARLPTDAPARLAAVRPELPFLIEEAVLYESRLGPGGARYEPRVTVALEARWAA